MVTDSNVGPHQKGKNRRISVPLPLARNSVIMIMIYVACYDVCYIFLYMEDIMVYVLHISIWKTLWYMYNAAAGAFMRYAGGRLGRWGCSRLLNRVAPPGGDGGFGDFGCTHSWRHSQALFGGLAVNGQRGRGRLRRGAPAPPRRRSNEPR